MQKQMFEAHGLVWATVSPGIYTTRYEGFRITCTTRQLPVSGFDCRGQRKMEPDLTFVAIKPGPPEPVRFEAKTFEGINSQILSTTVKTLF